MEGVTFPVSGESWGFLSRRILGYGETDDTRKEWITACYIDDGYGVMYLSRSHVVISDRCGKWGNLN